MKKASIIIPVWNGLEYTKQCVESIRENTEDYELIIVDNGSSDGTREWLNQLQIPNGIVICNETNLGPGAATNQGVMRAQSDYLVFLNNDAVVTPHWLEGLIECAESRPDVGIVGAMSNCVSGPQLVPNIACEDIRGLPGFATQFRERYRGKYTPFWRTIGPCYMVKKSVVDKIGGFDSQFFPGNYEDDDFCVRSILAGYTNLICGDVFIHHYGSKSFIDNGMNMGDILANNEEKFRKKWENNVEVGRIRSSSIVPTLGVVMIVKNEEGCLARCLESVKEVDEIVIVDTGSTDNTEEVARRYTGKYYKDEYKWNDNFAEARNYALDKCTTDWVISIDADEVMDEGGVVKIRNLIANVLNLQDAISVLMHRGYDQFYNTKVFRSHLRYTGRIHEYVSPAAIIEDSGVGIQFNISQSHAQDPDRNIRILEGDARQNPFDLRTQYCLMREYFIMGYYPNAIYWGERYKESVKAGVMCEAEYADAMFTLALCYENMMDYPKALSTCMECIVINADFKEACEMMARVMEKTGKMLNKDRWEEWAVNAQNRGLNFKTKGKF